LPVIPEQLQWRPAIALVCCDAGSAEDGERVVRVLRHFGRTLVDLFAPASHVAFQGALNATVAPGWHYYWKGTNLDYWKGTNLAGLSEDVIAVLAEHAYSAGSPRSYAAIFHIGRAVARVLHDATAYIYRQIADVKAKFVQPDCAYPSCRA
jgi:hypothetical protein